MKTMKKALLIALVVCMLPLHALAGWTPGQDVVCELTDDDLRGANIVVIDENKDESTTDGSGTSDIMVEDEDIERNLPSLVLGDGYIEINGVRYPYDIVKSTTGFKDVTDQLIEDAANDPSIRVYKETLGIDGDIIGKILEDANLPEDFNLGEFISNWERIIREINEDKDRDPPVTLDELEKMLDDVFSGKTIQGELDRMIQELLDWLKNNTITWKTFNKDRWDSFLEQLRAHQKLVNQRLHLLECHSLSGDVQVIATDGMAEQARVNGNSGLIYDVGNTTYTFTAMTPEYEDDRAFVKKVTQTAMVEMPIDVVAGRLATGNLSVDGRPSALHEYAEKVRTGQIQDTPEGFMAAYEKDLPLIEAYYTLYANGEVDKATNTISASSYNGASNKLSIPFGADEKRLMYDRLVQFGDESGVLGWYVDVDVVGSKEYEKYEAQSKIGESIASGKSPSVGSYGSQNNETAPKLTKEEKIIQDQNLDILTYNGALDWRMYGEDWNFNGLTTTSMDLITDKEFMAEVIDYWQLKSEDESLSETDRATASENLEAAKTLQQLNNIDASRVIEEEEVTPSFAPGPTVIGTHPSDSYEAAYKWSAVEDQANVMRGVFYTTYTTTGVYTSTNSTTQNGDPTMEQMAKLGFDTSGGYQLSLTIPNTEKNAAAIRMGEYLLYCLQKGYVGREHAEMYLSMIEVYDANGVRMDVSQISRDLGAWIDANPNASMSADGKSTKDNKGYIYRAGVHDDTFYENESVAIVNGEGFNNATMSLNDIPETAENISSIHNINTTASLYRSGQATFAQLEECVKRYPLYDKDGVQIPASSVLKAYNAEETTQPVQATEQPAQKSGGNNEIYWLVGYSSLYYLRGLDGDSPMDDEAYNDLLRQAGSRDAVGQAIIGTRLYSNDDLPEGVTLAGKEYRVDNNADFKVNGETIWTHDRVALNGSYIEVMDEHQLDSRSGSYVLGLDVFGANEALSDMHRETWDYRTWNIDDKEANMKFNGWTDSIARALLDKYGFPETPEEYEAMSKQMAVMYYGGTDLVLPSQERGFAIRNGEVGALYSDTNVIKTADIKRYAVYVDGVGYVISNPNTNKADEGKSFIIVDEERMNQMIEVYNLTPAWLKPYLGMRIAASGSDEPIYWEFNASAYVRDNTPTIDLDQFFDTHEESMYDALDRLTDGNVIASIELLKKQTSEAKKELEEAEKQLEEAKTAEEKKAAEEAIEAAKKKQSQYDNTVDALRIIYDYYITYGDEMDPSEWEMISDMVEAGRQMFPDLRQREEEKKQRKKDPENPEEEEDNTPETEEELKMRLSDEFIEYLVSLGVAVDEIPDKITLDWLKAKIGIEEVKKFFTGRTVYVDHYVTIKTEDIKIIDSEYCRIKQGSFIQWRSWTEGSEPPKIAENGGRVHYYRLGNETMYVTAGARVEKGRVIKTYFSSQETLILQPFGWVISNKTSGGFGVDGESMLLSKITQIVETDKQIKSWVFPIDPNSVTSEPESQTLIIGSITTIMKNLITGGYWINGYKYDGSGMIVVTIEGTSDPGLTYRIK